MEYPPEYQQNIKPIALPALAQPLQEKCGKTKWLDECGSLDEDFDSTKQMEVSTVNKDGRVWRMLCTPVVTVLVGPEARCFRLHRGLLIRYSSFFRTMLENEHFQECQSNIVKLPEDSVAAFAVFAEFLYVGSECDSGAIYKDAHAKYIDANDDNFPGVLVSNSIKREKGSSLVDERSEKCANQTMVDAEDTPSNEPEVDDTDDNNELSSDGRELGQESLELGSTPTPAQTKVKTNGSSDDSDCSVWETGSQVGAEADYDHYDFDLQFSCYFLADKLQAPEFKYHILREIERYGEHCDPSYLTIAHVKLIYENTAVAKDPLRRFCILLKCVDTPIDQTLADPEFQALMVQGGPLVKDVIDICRQYAIQNDWADDVIQCDRKRWAFCPTALEPADK